MIGTGCMAGTIDVPYFTYVDLIDYWGKYPYATGGRDRGELKNVAEVLLPAYIQAVTVDGIPVLDMSDRMLWQTRNRELRQYMIDRTGLTDPLVSDFLMVFYLASEEGVIDSYYMRPAEWDEMRPPTIAERLEPFWDPAVQAASATQTKFLVTAGIVVAVVFLGKAVINKVV